MDSETKQEFVKVSDQFGKVTEQFTKIDQQFAKVNQQFAKIHQRFEKIDKRFDKMDVRLEKILHFLYTKVALKSDLENYATKEDLHNATDQMLTKIDAIAVSHKKHDEELPVINRRLERLERKTGILPQPAIGL